MTAEDVKAALQAYAKPESVAVLGRFFKTGEGQYGAGDIFIGVRVPDTRLVCKKYKNLPLREVEELLKSPVHEHRLAAVILLSNQFTAADETGKKAIFDAYLQAMYDGHINNWDIVDTSAGYVIGRYLWDKPRRLLFTLARSKDLWQRRIAILSTFEFIMRGDASTTLEIAEILLHDDHDLIQKAVGWMLREVGKRCSEDLLLGFLDAHAATMPRTMLRYSVERLRPGLKRKYMIAKKELSP